LYCQLIRTSMERTLERAFRDIGKNKQYFFDVELIRE
jgi:hypothetical protein